MTLSQPLPFILALLAPAAPLAAAEPKLSFNRDIRPIMSDTCFHCHGFDAKTREAGLRLDLREDALKPTKNGVVPIVPGKPDESEIILRITDALDPMPPDEAHKTLTPKQKDLLRRWVAEGAVYEPHWAYAPLVRPAVPSVRPIRNPQSEIRNPIDAFVQARLAEKQIAPSPVAAPAALLRRLSLDLTGLPPTPAEVDAFVAASARDPEGAYRAEVDRLLASPHHGERLAVWWLDIARFSDTVGFHGDQNQRIFPYRDYVIGAFNRNLPFDRFTVEQLAGDLLPAPTPAQRVATGYNRLNMMTREGGAQPQEYLAKYGAERVRSVAAAWFGSTFGCAECHDHKFDPIKAKDFYELQSFFADVKQWGVYSDYGYTKNPELAGFNNDFPFPPEIEVDSPYLAARRDRAEAALREQVAALRRPPAEPAAFAAWTEAARARLAAAPTGWEFPAPTAAVLRAGKPAGNRTATVSADGTVALAQNLARQETLRLAFAELAGPVAALRLELPGDPVGDLPFEKAMARGAVTFAAAVRGADGKERKLAVVFADATAKSPRYINGVELHGVTGGWKLPPLRPAEPLAAIWLLREPMALAAGETLQVTLGGDAAKEFRLGVTALGAGRPLDAAAAPVIAALHADAPTPAQRELLLETWRLSAAPEPAAVAAYHRVAAELRDTRQGRALTMVTEATEPLPVRVLPRGNWQDESGPLVLPATPSFLPGRIESTPEKRLTRLDLARWLMSADNPITARAVANRLWALFFGTGLSAVVDDLGSQGELPSHPELLDWLAVEFREKGWDLRHVIRLIVTSHTYRQESQLRPELRESDPANRLLASQNPRRLEAEFVRDNALFIAGRLDLRDIGGPSAAPYQPDGYYAALQFPDRTYVASGAEAQWRRGVYMHWQRTFLHPMLANFDAPARDECAAQRVVSNTPQQALTLLNDPTFVEAAKLFAARVHAAAGTDAARLTEAFRLALARAPKPAERTALTALLAAQREHYRANVADAQKVLAVGLAPAPAGDPAELAAWTSVARVLLNTHEVITRY
jgi:hypothetical protein